MGRIVKYVRQNGNCPADEFLTSLEGKMRKKFNGVFHGIATDAGATYVVHERFRPLHGEAKPLWEFKEHDHRLYCLRKVGPSNTVVIVLFSGWIKQKSGRTRKEDREIEHAKLIYLEFFNEQGGDNV